ncbi:MAG: cyclase family protein [Gemmatimonadales bacterium]
MTSRSAGLFLSIAALTSCAPQAQQVGFDLSQYTLVDLTHSFTPETLYWPTSPSGFRLEQLAYGPTPAGFYSAYAFSAPEHGGTHLDAPIHFFEGGRTADEIPLEQLIAKAVVIDLSARAAEDRDARLSVEEVTAFEQEHGRIPAGAFVLLKTGWHRHWGDRMAYFGDTTTGDASKLHFPGYGVEAAKLLIEERQVTGLGVDSPSIDYGPSADFAVHRVLSARNGIALENLADLSGLPPVGATVIALPMKIAKGSGGPVRVIGLIPRT